MKGHTLTAQPAAVAVSPSNRRKHWAEQCAHCSHAIVLENLVYYRNDTHYLVMTAKADCLVRAGVCRSVSTRVGKPVRTNPLPTDRRPRRSI